MPVQAGNTYPFRAPPARRLPFMFPPVDTQNPAAVEVFVRERFRQLHPDGDFAPLARIFADVTDMFAGRYLDYQAIDLGYHDFQHTLQATVCFAEVAAGRHAAGAAPAWTSRQLVLGLTAVLLHDCGYLKLRSDSTGTGAKYTYTHVLRSCAVAAAHLPTRGFNLEEIDTVLGAIRCTGPTSSVRRLHFRSDAERLLGCAVATADYLAQMAAEDYPDELPILFREFSESDDYLNVPANQRPYRTADELIAKTPAFWRKVVQPKLDTEFEGVHRFLQRPIPGGPNPYLEAIERNLVRIQARS